MFVFQEVIGKRFGVTDALYGRVHEAGITQIA